MANMEALRELLANQNQQNAQNIAHIADVLTRQHQESLQAVLAAQGRGGGGNPDAKGFGKPIMFRGDESHHVE